MQSGYAALAKVGMHRREYMVVIRPRENVLRLHTMYYPNEIRALPEYGAQPKVKVTAPEVALAEQLVKSLAALFRPDRYHDEYQGRVLELVEARGAGKQLKGEPARRKAPVIDLIQALKQSLAAKKPTAQASTPVRRKRAHA